MCETIIRRTPHAIHGTKMIPIAKSRTMADQIILIVSYRVPIMGYVLEFPAGLSETEDLFACSVRELKEETGYVGTVTREIDCGSQVVFTDPWKSDDNEVIHFMQVDLDAEVNRQPEQCLDHEENISVIKLPLKDFSMAVLKFAQERHCAIDCSVWFFALGLSFHP